MREKSSARMPRDWISSYRINAAIMDVLEEGGVIEPSDGTNRARKVVGVTQDNASDDEQNKFDPERYWNG